MRVALDRLQVTQDRVTDMKGEFDVARCWMAIYCSLNGGTAGLGAR